MYKMLLADDEIVTRESTKKCIEETGLFQVDVAADGKKAVEMLQSGEYDTAVLDIMMPGYDGLQVLEQISSLHPAPIKVVLSGYDRFDYAQKALRFGVSDYLIKPLTPEQVRETVEKIAHLVDRRQAMMRNEQAISRELERFREMARERFLERIVCAGFEEGDIRDRLDYFGVAFPHRSFAVAMLGDAQQDTKTDVRTSLAVEMAIAKTLRDYTQYGLQVLTFHTTGDRIGVLFNYDREHWTTGVETVLEELFHNVYDYWSVRLQGGIGCEVDDTRLLGQSFREAAMAFRWNAVMGYGAATFYSDIYDRKIDEELDVNKLVAQISLGKKEDIFEQINAMICKQSSNDSSVFSVTDWVITACRIALKNSNAQGNQDHFNQAYAVLAMDYDRVGGSVDSILKELVTSTCSAVTKARGEKSGFYIKRAKDIILREINNGNSDINVGSIADELGLSKNYFGKVFKNATGLSVSNFVSNLRIQQAAELLRDTNMKVYEVGCRVGFENQHYFSAAFKQIIGVSPSEFRDLK